MTPGQVQGASVTSGTPVLVVLSSTHLPPLRPLFWQVLMEPQGGLLLLQCTWLVLRLTEQPVKRKVPGVCWQETAASMAGLESLLIVKQTFSWYRTV